MHFGQFVLWALLTGGITGAAWVAIVMVRRQQRIDGRRAGLDELGERMEELEASHDRVAELEARLDFAERLLVQHREEAAKRVGPP